MFQSKQLDRIEKTLETLRQLLWEVARSSHRVEQDRSMIMATLDDLLVEVEAEKAIDTSIVALVNGLSAQLAAAVASNDPAKVQAVLDGMKANAANLSAAIVANTPAAPAP
jgi:hypothetical protein